MPPPGWYDDPEQQWTWRWWDGTRWTDLRAPMWVPPQRDPTSFSAWFEKSVACVKVVVRRVGLVILTVWVALLALGGVIAFTIYNSDRGQELRRLLEVERPTDVNGNSLWTDADADRAWELVRGLFRSAIPWLVVASLLFFVVSAWTTALVARVAVRHLADPDAREPLGELASGALRRVPAVVGSGLVIGLVAMAPFVIAAIPILVAVALDGGALIAVTAVFAIPAAVVLAAWLWGRLALTQVIAATGGHGLGIRHSWELTQGRFWGTIGRVIVASLIASVITTPLSFLNLFGFALGVVGVVALWLVLQALSGTAGVIVQMSSLAAIVDQLSRDDHFSEQ